MWPRVAAIGVVLLVGAGIGAVFAVRALSGASLTADPTALAHVSLQALGGRITAIHATDSHGKRIPVFNDHGTITPLTKVAPGETIHLTVTHTRRGIVSWALGSSEQEHLTIQAPKPAVASHWITELPNGTVRVSFDHPVTRVVIENGTKRRSRTLKRPERTITVGHTGTTGTFKIAAASRSWEHVGGASPITYFPSSSETVAVGEPAPGGRITPVTPIRLTFSRSVSAALGRARPTLTPAVPGHWTTLSSHSIEFRPSAGGLALGSTLTVGLPKTVAVVGPYGGPLHSTQTLTYTVPPGSMLRLQQLLAQKGFLPVAWMPTGDDVAQTPAAQARAAVIAPAGTFTWRYPDTPHELVAQWTPGQLNVITKGAVMQFENANNMTTDGVAGPAVWSALLSAAVKGTGASPVKGYSYVFVHRKVPQLLTLWHDGKVVTTSPGNTGVPAAPTQLGTFPVFEHLAVTTMSGTNPDGTKYHDPGIKWVSYFNGGDALHSFNRASFGTPQSLGCVELPLAAAAKIWPYTPIGTLVTIEN